MNIASVDEGSFNALLDEEASELFRTERATRGRRTGRPTAAAATREDSSQAPGKLI